MSQVVESIDKDVKTYYDYNIPYVQEARRVKHVKYGSFKLKIY
jgi:hypothetical protein